MKLTMVELCQLGPGPIVEASDGFSCHTDREHRDSQQCGDCQVEGYLETLTV